MGRKTVLIGIIAVTAIAGTCFLFNQQKKALPIPVSYSTPKLWERILDEPGTFDIPQSTRAVIFPHHLITATELTKFYRGLANKFQPKIIFLIGPNHYEEGESDIQTCDCTYSTIRGKLTTNKIGFQNAVKNSPAIENNKPFEKEHSIYAHATFIKNFFPDAEIVPFILKWKTLNEEIDQLVNFMNTIANEQDVLVIASVDFSHYISHLAADFHDQSSFNAIKNFDQASIKAIEVDSPASVRLVTRWAEQKNLMNVSLLRHTNSQDFFRQKTLEHTTSHQFIAFSEGEMETESQVSMHFFGDAMFDRNIGSVIESEDILATLAGEEGRFFQGNNYNILNLEGVLDQQNNAQNKEVVFSFDSKQVLPLLKKYNFNAINLANNHIFDYFSAGSEETRNLLNEADILSFGTYEPSPDTRTSITKNNLKIALCGFNDVGNMLPVKTSLEIVAEAKRKNDFVFLNIHWGEEYSTNPTKRQRELAKKFIDAGADLIIGHHPHVIQPMEIYKGKPIFYSLGNFIFDQNLPEEVKTGLSVGVIATSDKITLYLFPFHTNKGEPLPYSDEKNRIFLEEFLQGMKQYETDILGKLVINQ